MLLKRISILAIAVLVAAGKLSAQTPCTALGQNPSTAFPVCGTATFYQDSVPFCSSNILYVPGCSIYGDTLTLYQNKNPYWYKFTCFQSGTLQFIIVPNNPNEDYDWQLYDVTGHNPDDVYTDTSLIISGNWSGTYGPTGANDTGLVTIACASLPEFLFSTFALSPNLIQGHNYLLLVSHFSDTQQGYSLSFGGGTAVITDTIPPHAINANRASCDGTQIMVQLNKKMKCSTVAADGSDFIISPPLANVIAAVGIGCTNGFDTDSVLLTFNQPLPFGNYNLLVQNGTDGNSILDICDTGLPVGEALPFTVLSLMPVPLNGLQNNKCSTDSLILQLADSVQCVSVAPNGSDFIVTGTYSVNIASAAPAYCVNGLTTQIIIRLASAMQLPGNFQVVLQRGSDGNTLLSKCDTPSVAGSFLPFIILPKPVADFSLPASICLPNAFANFTNRSTIADGTESLFQYFWSFDDPASGLNNNSTLKDPTHRYNSIRSYNVNLRVTSGGGCIKDTTIVFSNIHPQPKTNFDFSKPAVCIGDPVTLTDLTNSMDGSTVQWNWSLGDGSIRHTQNVTYTYSTIKTFAVTLYSMNSYGCYSDTLTKSITVYPYPTVYAGPDRVVLSGGQLTLVSQATGDNLQYLWTPATYLDDRYIPNPRCIAPQNDIMYRLTVTGTGGCAAWDDVFVKVLKMPKIPNTFTPNNDGINDRWVIQYLEDYPNNHLQVFTRAGQLVYESRGLYKAWDGLYKGRPVPYDTYFYILEPGSGREPVTGYVTIIK